jgi:hypothetical protein
MQVTQISFVIYENPKDVVNAAMALRVQQKAGNSSTDFSRQALYHGVSTA